MSCVEPISVLLKRDWFIYSRFYSAPDILLQYVLLTKHWMSSRVCHQAQQNFTIYLTVHLIRLDCYASFILTLSLSGACKTHVSRDVKDNRIMSAVTPQTSHWSRLRHDESVMKDMTPVMSPSCLLLLQIVFSCWTIALKCILYHIPLVWSEYSTLNT